MSNYKLIPAEPTAEMVEAAEEAYMPFGDMDLAIRMAVLTAPAVRGEPEGQAIELLARVQGWWQHTDGDMPASLEQDIATLLAAAPQPAEQKPVCPTCDGRGWSMDWQNELIRVTCSDCAGSGKAEHSITVQESDSAEPDVSTLAEALEWLRGAINRTPSSNDKYQSGTWISTNHPRIKQIDTILATYRKQQKGEV